MDLSAPKKTPSLLDIGPKENRLREDVLSGLGKPQKMIPPKYFYDKKGSQLFDEICEQEAYYPTRTEMAIMERYVDEMVRMLGKGTLLVEFGSGSSLKTHSLLDALPEPAGYVPIDISGEHLLKSAQRLQKQYPGIPVFPIWADYNHIHALPALDVQADSVMVYFPGSTIGNFKPDDALTFLTKLRQICEPSGGILIGVDLIKSHDILEKAYNDPDGVTAAFNMNLLERINKELGGTFDLNAFEHYAFYNETEHRIEMHLKSLRTQSVQVDGKTFHFTADETIHTEYSYKYNIEQFGHLSAEAGLYQKKVWTDPASLFSVQFLNLATD